MKLPIRASIDQIKTFSRVFVERPRFAMVIAIVLSMAGVMAIWKLPIAQYPQLTPPEISVTYSYPGANAREVMNTVATPLEDEVNGVDDMLYMTSDCTDDGQYQLKVSFEVESDRDMDLVKVQNRCAQAAAKLPAEVKQLGGRLRAQSTDFLGFFALRSPKGTISRMKLSDYAYANLQPVLLRVEGVGECTIYGPKLSMRVWLDPARLAAQGMNSEEVIAAVTKQNIQASLGTVGASPTGPHGAYSYTLLAKGRLMTPEEFDEIVVRRDANGGIVKLKDVARTEIGEQNYMFAGTYDGGNSVQIALQQKPGANAIKSMDAVQKELERLKEFFPPDMEIVLAYDATDFVRRCIKEIVETLLITFALVVFVCYLFLQDWRATLIPCITIPVSLSSTFIVMALLGYSINILTLFGLVLAIGVVVDDCIVVVERVQFLIETRGLNAKEATIQAMSDVTSAVIATTLVLLGIFVPVGFMSGITGRIYQQFSVTLSAAVCFSTVCALTLAPALCSLLLHEACPFRHGPFAWFNWAINAFKGFFVRIAKWLASRIFLAMMLLILTILLTVSMFNSTQTSFLPEEDQRVVFMSLELPEGSTRQRSVDICSRAQKLLSEKIPEVQSILTISGFSLVAGRGENLSTMIVELLPWEQRKRRDQSVQAVMGKINAVMREIPEPAVKVFVPPAIPGLGANSGIDLRIQSKGDVDPMRLDNVTKEVLGRLNALPTVMAAFSGYTAQTPHLRFSLDRDKAEMFKVPVATVYATLQNYLGSRYVNDVNLGTQVNRVTVQSDWEGRAAPESVEKLYVRSETGAMVPIGSLGTISREIGPRAVSRYNMFLAAGVTVMPKPGADPPGAEGGPSRGLRLRVVGHHVPGAAQRRLGRSAHRARDSVRIPLPRRPVRAVDDSAPRHALNLRRGVRRTRGAQVVRNLDDRRSVFAVGVRAARSRPSHRPRLEERDSHRRVREGQARERGLLHSRRRWHRRGRAPQGTSHDGPHDAPRNSPDDDRDRRGRCEPQPPRHDRVLGHVRVRVVRNPPGARALRALPDVARTHKAPLRLSFHNGAPPPSAKSKE